MKKTLFVPDYDVIALENGQFQGVVFNCITAETLYTSTYHSNSASAAAWAERQIGIIEQEYATTRYCKDCGVVELPDTHSERCTGCIAAVISYLDEPTAQLAFDILSR